MKKMDFLVVISLGLVALAFFIPYLYAMFFLLAALFVLIKGAVQSEEEEVNSVYIILSILILLIIYMYNEFMMGTMLS